MSKATVTIKTAKADPQLPAETTKPADRPQWETPKLDDVSEQVMAQPYIRFT